MGCVTVCRGDVGGVCDGVFGGNVGGVCDGVLGGMWAGCAMVCWGEDLGGV